MAGMMRALGTMSGTSLDGIDVALIETDGEAIGAVGPCDTFPYTDAERQMLRQALLDAIGLDAASRAARPGCLAAAEAMVTARHADAVRAFMARHGLAGGQVDVVGFHGQTVLHRPDTRLTLQLGEGAGLASEIGIPVVSDFRGRDVAAGGQGAPLVPIYHRARVMALGAALPVAVVNIGGVSNITFVGEEDLLLACDTGPGNALLDDFMLARTGVAMDRDGVAAARGRVNAAVIAAVLAEPFFAAPLPKSLDRNAFAHFALPDPITTEDGAATLTALTAAAIAAVRPLLPAAPALWIVCGGGARNPTMMAMLADDLAPARVSGAQEVGWNPEAIEAEAFAFLAVRAVKTLPLTFPGTTGVSAPLTGGVYFAA